MFFHEREDVAAGIASEAFEKPFVGMDMKRGRVLVVERAQPNQVFSALAQLNVRTDEAPDVDASANLINGPWVDRHQRPLRRSAGVSAAAAELAQRII